MKRKQLTMKYLYLMALLLIISSFGCNRQNDEYTFVVAGHSYGNPTNYQSGFYPPFWASLMKISALDDVSFAVLTGDIVPRGTLDNWLAVRSQIDSLDYPVYIAPGNHDLINPKLFEKYGGPPYMSFYHNEDLIIILNSNDGWKIQGEQLNFLLSALEKAPNRVFIFVHHVLWWSPMGKYSDIKPNWIEGRGEDVNFQSEILPLLHDLHREIYVFAGDVGAVSASKNIYYFRDSKVHLIASGMGNGRNDHYLVVKVTSEDVNIQIQPLCHDCPRSDAQETK